MRVSDALGGGAPEPPPERVEARPAASRGGRIAIIIVMVAAAALIVAYWTVWFGGGRNLLASSHAASYYTFENAFPAADGWLALNRPWALLWGLLAGGAGVYLGCMDVLFDLENGIYLAPKGGDPSAVIIEASINVLTFLLSAVVITYLWRRRRDLLAADR